MAEGSAGVAGLTGRLVSIPSENPDLVAGGAGEAELAGYVAGWLEEAGLEVVLDEPVRGRPSVLATVRGSGGGRSLILNAHLDTVGAGGMNDPFRPRLEGGRLHGRGAYDMKASLAAIMLAARQLSRAGDLAGDVIVTAVADEEVASLGTASAVRRVRADAAIVTEPTELALCLGHKGFVWLAATTAGVAAHGSRPDLGVDAIAAMAPVLAAVSRLAGELEARPAHHLLGHGSIHAGVIEGGRELSTYPESCTLRIERRTLPGEDADVVLGELAALTGPDTALELLLQRPPSEIDRSHAVVEAVAEAAAARLGGPRPEIGVPYWMDAAILTEAGIPTVTFGPAGAGAHADVEWVDVESVAACVDVYVAAARRFCGRS